MLGNGYIGLGGIGVALWWTLVVGGVVLLVVVVVVHPPLLLLRPNTFDLFQEDSL